MRNILVSKDYLKKVVSARLCPQIHSTHSEITLYFEEEKRGCFPWSKPKKVWASHSLRYVNKFIRVLEETKQTVYEGEIYTHIEKTNLYEPTEELLLDYEEIKRIISGNDNQST